MSKEKKLRIFIALNLPAHLKEKIALLLEEWEKTAAMVKWVKPENLHFTLKFLGYLTQEELNRVKEACPLAIREFRPFNLGIAGMGRFPETGAARVIWLGVDKGREELIKLANKIEESLDRYKFPRESRPFSAHLTLGRVKEIKGKEKLLQAIEHYKEINIGEFFADRLSIIKSEISSRGPTYTTLETLTF